MKVPGTFEGPMGNRLSSQGQAPAAGRSTEYVYDFENRLIEVNYTGMVAQYKYDPFGRRIQKIVNNGTPVTTRYVYDGPNIVAQYDGSWNVTAKYIHTPDIDDPLTVTQGENTYYYHRDGLGSVVNLTDSNGYIAKTYTYKSFGEINSETGSVVQPFAFTGREYDPESGLYFYRARYYDPRAGRFLTKDPIGFAGGDVNLYRYTRNNPINFTDPRGLWTIGIGLGATAGAGAAASGSGMIVFDGHGNVGVIESGGGGGMGGHSYSYGGIIQLTNADSIYDLKGLSTQTGGSLNIPFGPFSSLGAEYVVGFGANPYMGVNINIGWGGGLTPVELHSIVEYATVQGGNVFEIIKYIQDLLKSKENQALCNK